MPESGFPEYWIAGGIGIAPFIAWLESLVAEGERRPGTQLYYCVHKEDAIYTERLQQLSKLTGVKIMQVDRRTDGDLDLSSLEITEDTQIWFCGPKRLRDMLLTRIPSSQLHYEQFDFR